MILLWCRLGRKRRETETKFQNSVSSLCWVQQEWLCESCESQLEHFFFERVLRHIV